MSIDLHAFYVPTWLQILDAMAAVMDKAAAFCAEQTIDEGALLDRKLADDMLPLGFQIKSAWVHSAGAIDGLHAGVFGPDRGPTPQSFAEAREKLVAAREKIAALDPAELNAFVGRDMAFAFGDYRREFTAEGFLQSFSLPNFFFHATTTYAILRAAGVPIGKRDFMGQMQVKG